MPHGLEYHARTSGSWEPKHTSGELQSHFHSATNIIYIESYYHLAKIILCSFTFDKLFNLHSAHNKTLNINHFQADFDAFKFPTSQVVQFR